MHEILIIIFLIIALLIIGLVLIQQGKGADMGASFGAGASGTLFGSAGTGNFLTRTTTILGVLFFIVSLALANLGGKKFSDDTFYNIETSTSSELVTQPNQAIQKQENVIDSIPTGSAVTQEQDAVTSTSDIPE